jgi:hypothetical protein
MRDRSTVIRDVADVVLMLAAVSFAGVFAYGVFGASNSTEPGLGQPSEETILGWEDEIPTGLRIGPSEGQVRIVSFIDFQCSFCRLLAHRLYTLAAEYPGAISFTMHHFPLSHHAFALPAAIGAECADEQGVLEDYYRAVLLGPDPLGVHSLDTYGDRAGAADPDRFRECLETPAEAFPRIAYGLNLGRETGVRGTPTVWFEGLRLVGTPSVDRLRELMAGAGVSRFPPDPSGDAPPVTSDRGEGDGPRQERP